MKAPRESSRMPFGDIQVELERPLLTRAAIIEITGAAPRDTGNWIARNIIDIGKKQPNGRNLYSVVDACELAVLVELSDICAVPPALAAAVATWTRKRCLQRAERDPGDKLNILSIGKSGPVFLRVWFQSGNAKIAVMHGMKWLVQYAHGPLIVVPLDDLIHRVTVKAFAALERQWNAQTWPTASYSRPPSHAREGALAAS